MRSATIKDFRPLGYATGEAINTLCTNLTFAGENIKKIMITSCHESEGKSFLSMNIMRRMAKLGKSVVLVDADLRRSMINQRYGIQFSEGEDVGLAHLLVGYAKEEDIVCSTNIKGAYFVPVGREVTDSLALLSSPRFSRLLDTLARSFDYVIVDAPPVGTIIDAAEIAKSCDGTVVAISYNSISRNEIQEVKMQLEQSNCRVLGVVLNNVEMDSYIGRKYYYKSHYYKYDQSSQPKKRTLFGEKKNK